jgi:hypothetical protein
MIAEDERKAEQSSGVFIANAQTRISNLQGKLQRLLDGYLDQDIDQPTYRTKQAELMSEKKSLEEQIAKLTLAANSWVEPMRQWLKQAGLLRKTANSGDFVAIKQAFLEMDGLNLFFSKKEARLLPRPEAHSPQENIWVLLRKTLEKTGATRLKSLESPFLVKFYNSARTYFEENC